MSLTNDRLGQSHRPTVIFFPLEFIASLGVCHGALGKCIFLSGFRCFGLVWIYPLLFVFGNVEVVYMVCVAFSACGYQDGWRA